MALAEPWNLRSRARECHITGRAFEDGETIVTALFSSDQDGFERRDYCADAWKQRDSESTSAPFSFWQSTFRPPVRQEKAEVVEKESAEDLLRRLVEEDEETTENVRYILAVMLERKKLLRETDNQPTNNGILRIYEHRKTGEVFIIRDPNISLDQIESIQEEVVMMLESGGRPPAEETEAAEEAEAENTAAAEEENAEPPEDETPEAPQKPPDSPAPSE
jgi:hypothetical protein